jgi:hypothetical protein
MPDISMCRASDCLFSETCKRHADSGTRPTPLRQAYMDFTPDAGGKGCDAYWHTAQTSMLDTDDNGDIAPDEPGDGRIVRKQIDD